ncbi:MAG: hypothetical protein ACRDOH_28410, partial [Streptosporangiaceae bacterium]
MGTSHPESAGPGQPRPPVTLLESFSPYGSRKVTVEYDGLTTAAYLHDGTSAISATWIANHRPAPPAADQARLDAGRAPLMPAARTKHPPAGRRCWPARWRRCGSRKGTGSRSWRTDGRSRSSRAGPPWIA